MDHSTANLALAIGARVKQERQARGWTLDQLAEAAGVSRRMVVNVEQGAANPSVGTLLRLSDALGVGLPALVEPPEPKSVKVTRAVRARRCGAVRPVAAECWWPAPHRRMWSSCGTGRWDPGDQHASEAHAAGHQGTRARPGGLDHRRGRRPVGRPSTPGMRSRSPATSPTPTPTRAPSRRGSPWPSSSPASARSTRNGADP